MSSIKTAPPISPIPSLLVPRFCAKESLECSTPAKACIEEMRILADEFGHSVFWSTAIQRSKMLAHSKMKFPEIGALQESLCVVPDWKRPILSPGEATVTTINLEGGWEVHLLQAGYHGSSPGTGSAGLCLTKDGLLNDFPSGRAAWRLFDEFDPHSPIDPASPPRVYIVEQCHFFGRKSVGT